MSDDKDDIIAKLITDVEFLKARGALNDSLLTNVLKDMPIDFALRQRDSLILALKQFNEGEDGPEYDKLPYAQIFQRQWREAALERIQSFDDIIASKSE